ncbi:hypothetical protein ABOM_004861 [Aspergillus bombycis]|uniref:Uncharacterized protein n=1 Tax=Aspergillus bombycis TaxID=109264 RepID=A0A1F8A377_9EURO|nr:hypothetical protein ABOM_004861 [Aspergillus bombycis]OGM46182.1 hypothetical protein ABOM_004861 [Aspergillus bombycis]
MDELKLPTTNREWQNAVGLRNLTDKTVHGAELASASQMGYEQFLLLRVLWKMYETNQLQIKSMFGMADWISRADEMLAGHRSWRTFCDDFAPAVIPEGDFSIARLYQLEVEKTKNLATAEQLSTPIVHRTRTRQLETQLANIYLATPSKRPKTLYDTPVVQGTHDDDDDDLALEDELTPLESTPFEQISPAPKELANVLYPPSKDEQIVNTALVVFLNALTMRFNLSSSWTMHRIALTAGFKDAQFEARTDGYLDDSHGKPSVLIEVKPVSRSTKQAAIQIQESAQMVAWIKSDDHWAERRKLRFHVSQDRHEIYVTVAEYSDEYLAYLNSSQPAPNESTDQELSGEELPKPPLSFLTMHQFGPFDTLLASHIREIGPILLAITLRAEAESSQAV